MWQLDFIQSKENFFCQIGFTFLFQRLILSTRLKFIENEKSKNFKKLLFSKTYRRYLNFLLALTSFVKGASKLCKALLTTFDICQKIWYESLLFILTTIHENAPLCKYLHPAWKKMITGCQHCISFPERLVCHSRKGRNIFGQFHQHFTSSFYACRFQKHKKDWWLDCIFCTFRICSCKSWTLNTDEIDTWKSSWQQHIINFVE